MTTEPIAANLFKAPCTCKCPAALVGDKCPAALVGDKCPAALVGGKCPAALVGDFPFFLHNNQ